MSRLCDRSETSRGGNMSKKGKIGKIGKKIEKKIEVLGNMSKIGKKCQDCVTYLKQAGVVI